MNSFAFIFHKYEQVKLFLIILKSLVTPHCFQCIISPCGQATAHIFGSFGRRSLHKATAKRQCFAKSENHTHNGITHTSTYECMCVCVATIVGER